MSDELGKSLQHSINQKFGRGTYRVLQPIKRGADGYVYKIQFIKQKRLGALKVLPKTLLTLQLDNEVQIKNKYRHDCNLQRKAQNQIKIHSSIHSSYVVQLQNWSKDDINYYLVLEYIAKGDLGDQIKKNIYGLSFSRVRKIGLQLAKAIDTIHKKGIIHRDIKPQNILLTQQDDIKICDFSCATLLKKNQKISGAIGTLQFMAPQIFGKYDNSIDIWSYGCILFVMAMGYVPFKLLKYELSDYMRKVNKVGVSELKKNLLSIIKINSQQNTKHANDQECKGDTKNHEECCKKLVNLLKKIFEIDVSKRITMNSIIKHSFFTGQVLNQIQESDKKNQQIQQNIQPINNNINNHIKNSQNTTDRSNQNVVGFIKNSWSNLAKKQQKQINIVQAKPSYSLQNMKKYTQSYQNQSKTTQVHHNQQILRNTHQSQKQKKRSSQPLQKYRQRANGQNYNPNLKTQNHIKNNSNVNQSNVKQIKQNIQTKCYNNQNVNTLNQSNKNRCGKIVNTTKYPVNNPTQQLLKFKLHANNPDTTTNPNKFISDGTHPPINPKPKIKNSPPYQNSIPSISQPLNCQGINYEVQYNQRQFITINENGLKGQFFDTGKMMMISPKGGHIKIVYGQKSKQYQIQKLPQKYTKLYNFYKQIVQQVKISLLKQRDKDQLKPLKNNTKYHHDQYQKQTRICRTSRDKLLKNNNKNSICQFYQDINQDSLESIDQLEWKRYKDRPNSQQHFTYHQRNYQGNKFSEYNVSASVDIRIELNHIPEGKQKLTETFTLRLMKYQSPFHQIKAFILNGKNPLQLSVTQTKFHKQQLTNILLQLLSSYHNIQHNKQQYKSHIFQQNKDKLSEYIRVIKDYCYWLHNIPCIKIHNRNKDNISKYNENKQNCYNYKINQHQNNYSDGNCNYSNKGGNNCSKYPIHMLVDHQKKQVYRNKQKYYDHKKLLQQPYSSKQQ